MLENMLAGSSCRRLMACLLCSVLLHVAILSLEGGHVANGSQSASSGPLIVTELRRSVMPEASGELLVPAAARQEIVPAQPQVQVPKGDKRSAQKEVSAGEEKSSPLPIKYYSRSELNRYPVLLTTLPTDIGQDPELIMLQPGEAIFRVFINTEGVVVLVEPEESNLPAVLTQRARQVLMKARFMPGYWSGNPVPSMLRWRFDIVPNMRTSLQIREVESK